MARLRRGLGSAGRIVLSIHLWSLVALATKEADICADINTSSGDEEVWLYQSHGHCGDLCRAGDFAFAILQDDRCWCSNFAPAKSTQVDQSECDTTCPGFDERCGGSNAFGYLALAKKPSGTLDSEPSAKSTMSTVTADGTVKTVTITPTAGVDSPNTSEFQSRKKSPSTGTIVGIVVGVALGIIVLFALGCFIKIRRENRRNEGSFEVRSVAASGTGVSGVAPGGMSQVKRDASFMSTSGIVAGVAGVAARAGNRRSRLMPIDPRMDPDTAPGIYVRNKSHESVHTLHDDQDYSRRVVQPRVLRATNPDPDPDD